jgi:hypothetical protein
LYWYCNYDYQNLSSDHLLSGVSADYKKSEGGVNDADGACLERQ